MTEYTITYKGKEYQKPFDYSEATEELDFLCHHDLTKEDLYKITLWKVNRFPIITDDIIVKLNSLRTLKTLDEEKTREVLHDLLRIKGVRLPMASTYLRFLNPDVYQIIDVRAYRAAFNYTEQPDYTKADNNECIDIYLNYLKKLKTISVKGYHGFFVGYENLDRFLYDVDKCSGYSLSENPRHSECVIINSIKKLITKTDGTDGI